MSGEANGSETNREQMQPTSSICDQEPMGPVEATGPDAQALDLDEFPTPQLQGSGRTDPDRLTVFDEAEDLDQASLALQKHQRVAITRARL